MTSEQFVYWLQGFTELHGAPPSAEQWESIKAHLQTVFNKVTPKLGGLGKPALPYYPPGVRGHTPHAGASSSGNEAGSSHIIC